MGDFRCGGCGGGWLWWIPLRPFPEIKAQSKRIKEWDTTDHTNGFKNTSAVLCRGRLVCIAIRSMTHLILIC